MTGVERSEVEFALVGRRVVTPEGVRPAAILIGGGLIRAVVELEAVPPGVPVEDAGDRVILPGLVDPHVHINEPGRTEWEGFETATRAAAAGGVTTLVDMPLNSAPVTTTVAALERKREAARGKLRIDCGFHGGLVPGNIAEIEPLIDAGVTGIKAFLVHSGIDDFPAAGEPELRAALPILARRNVPLLVHCELPGAGTSAPSPTDPRSYAAYLASRPPDWELRAIRLVLALCAEYRAPVHIVHLATAEALPELRRAREAGLPATVETCPHYLTLSAETISDGDTRFKCAPPIRGEANRQALWNGLREGVIDLIASDHSPCPPEMKHLEEGDFFRAWGGIASLQLGLAAVWTEARRQGFDLTDLAAWMSLRPAALAGLAGSKGAIQPGADADLVVWDPEEAFEVAPEQLHHRHKLTPYASRTLHGIVHTAYLRGCPVYREGEFIGELQGRLLRR